MSVAANRYAKALIDVLSAENAEAGFEQLQTFAALLENEPDAARILENPTIPADRRNALLGKISDALQFKKPVSNLLNLLVERDRLSLLEEIITAFQKLMDERLGIVRAHVRSARPLDSGQQQEIANKLQAATGKKVRMDLSVDPTLLGGFVAQVGTTIYDGSLQRQLQSIRNRLIEE